MRKLLILAVLLGGSFFTSVLFASTLPPNIEEMTKRAGLVIIGDCKSSEDKGQEGKLNVVTVEKIIKNELGFGVEVGKDLEFTTIPSALTLTSGQKYMLFLRQYKGRWDFVGGEMGVFQINKSADGKTMVRNAVNNKGLLFDARNNISWTKFSTTPSQPLSIKKEISDRPKQVEGPIELDKMVNIVDQVLMKKQ